MVVTVSLKLSLWIESARRSALSHWQVALPRYDIFRSVSGGYVWREIDLRIEEYGDLDENVESLYYDGEHHSELYEELATLSYNELIAKGEADSTTMVNISVMMYWDEDFEDMVTTNPVEFIVDVSSGLLHTYRESLM